MAARVARATPEDTPVCKRLTTAVLLVHEARPRAPHRLLHQCRRALGGVRRADLVRRHVDSARADRELAYPVPDRRLPIAAARGLRRALHAVAPTDVALPDRERAHAVPDAPERAGVAGFGAGDSEGGRGTRADRLEDVRHQHHVLMHELDAWECGRLPAHDHQ